jgi:hypothetical protein
MTSYYISGPMRGYPRFNFDAFLACEAYLWNAFATSPTIHNPAQKDLDLGFDPDSGDDVDEGQLAQWMRRDLTDVAASSNIILLPGWERSEGARRELSVAKWCGLHPFEYDPEGPKGYRLSWRSWDQLASMVTETEVLADLEARIVEAEQASTSAEGFTPHPLAVLGEVRVTNELTGGQKGSKPERYDLVPVGPLAEVARLYAYGASKYADRNWENGYDWHLSYAALQRHANTFWSGADVDEESGCHHLASVVFHAFAMIEWGTTHTELDDRP